MRGLIKAKPVEINFRQA